MRNDASSRSHFPSFHSLSGIASASPPCQLTLEFHHLWHGEPLTIPAAALTREQAGDEITLTRLAYLLSSPRVQTKRSTGILPVDSGRPALENETDWLGRDDWFAYVNAADATGNDGIARLTLAGLPRGQYSAFQFHIGPDAETDQADPNQFGPDHPLNPIRNNLHWSWQGSYIYLTLEGQRDAAPSGASRSPNEPPRGFSYHLGNAPHRMAVTLPVDLDLTSKDAVVALDFHLDRVLDADPPIDIGAQSSTHGRPGDDLAMTLKTRIEQAFTIREIRATEPAAAPVTKNDASDFVGTPYPFTVKKGFPLPALPTDYPLTEERVALGNRLFHDPILSRDDTISCASCHHTERAFTDGQPFSIGIDGQTGTRNAMPLSNLAWKSDGFFWDGRAPSLREQALVPIEILLEMHESLDHVVAKLAADEDYAALFEEAFGPGEITSEQLGIAIEQFVLTLTSFDSRFDRSVRGDSGDALTGQEKRGFELFFTEYDPRRRLYGADCFHCHGGAFFTDYQFHNNGLPPTDDLGLEKVTGLETDQGKFFTPSLRNVALTAPYMHDGRFETLEEVLDHYTGGVEPSPTLDPNLAKHPRGGVPLSEEDQAAIIAFLKTLTDPQFTAAGEQESPR